MVTFEVIILYSIPIGIVKKNNSLEFIIEGCDDIKEVVTYSILWIMQQDKKKKHREILVLNRNTRDK